MQIGAGAPRNIWGIGAEAAYTNSEKDGKVRSEKFRNGFGQSLTIYYSGGKEL